MIIESVGMLEQLLSENAFRRSRRIPKKVLLCTPDHFRIEYAINPYMRAVSGGLKVAKQVTAQQQWEELRAFYSLLGYSVATIDGHPEFPDMVFAANQTFPFLNEKGEKSVLLSRMRSKYRSGEVGFFRQWFADKGYQVYELKDKNAYFEGNGDALVHYPYNLIWGGYGHRTSREAYDEIANALAFT